MWSPNVWVVYSCRARHFARKTLMAKRCSLPMPSGNRWFLALSGDFWMVWRVSSGDWIADKKKGQTFSRPKHGVRVFHKRRQAHETRENKGSNKSNPRNRPFSQGTTISFAREISPIWHVAHQSSVRLPLGYEIVTKITPWEFLLFFCWWILPPSTSAGKKDLFKELRITFIMFANLVYQDSFS